MALKLFVDPNEGSRALARGIEKFGEGVGKAIQGYRQKKQLEEQTLGLLANTDPLNISQSPGFTELEDPKKQSEFLLAKYDSEYPSLGAKKGALQKYAIAQEKADKEAERNRRDQIFESTEIQIKKQNAALESANRASEEAKGLLSDPNAFSFTNNLLEDREGAFANYERIKAIQNLYPDIPEAAGIRKMVQKIDGSPELTTFRTQLQSKSEKLQTSAKLIPSFNQYYAKDIAEGNIQPVDVQQLQMEIYSDQVDGPEMMKIRAGNYGILLNKYLSETRSPGLMLEVMRVPSLTNIKNRQDKLPTIQEMRDLETFDEMYERGDLKLFNRVPAGDTRSAMILSAMNVDPETKEPRTIQQGDQELIASLLAATRGIKDVLGMLGSNTQQEYVIAGEKIDVSKTNNLRTQWADLKAAVSPTGEKPKDLAAFRNRIAMMVTDLARGVFGEVGVLTDADVIRYEKLLADPRTPAETNIILSEMLLDTVRDKADDHFRTLAASGKNVAGFIPTYNEIAPESSLPFRTALSELQGGKITVGETLSIQDPDTKQYHRIQVTDPERLMSDLTDQADQLSANLKLEQAPSVSPGLPSTETFSGLPEREPALRQSLNMEQSAPQLPSRNYTGIATGGVPAYLRNSGANPNQRLFGAPGNQPPQLFRATRQRNQGYNQPTYKNVLSDWTRIGQ